MSKKSLILSSALIIFLSFGCFSAYANTIHVPGDYPTIQQAINAANPGDTILVAPGIYQENLTMKDQIILLGENKATTEIWGNSSWTPTIMVANNCKISNFTLKYSNISIKCFSISVVEISECIFQSAANHIEIDNSSDISIEYNEFDPLWGSGGSSIVLKVNTGDITIKNNHFNSGNGYGVGFQFSNDSGNTITISDNIFVDNYMGVNLFSIQGDSSAIIQIINNIITNSSVMGSSIGINFFFGINSNNQVFVTNNTITNQVKGIYIGEHSKAINPKLDIKNNIISDNSGFGVDFPNPYGNLDVTIAHNDIWNNTTNYNGVQPGYGDISLDPLFIDKINLDFHLQAGSPCIETGDPNSQVPVLGGDRIDMGAYEYGIRFNDYALAFSNYPSTVNVGIPVTWDVTLTNHLSIPVTIDIWIDYVSANTSGIIAIAKNVTIPPNRTIKKTFSTSFSLLGKYTIRGMLGYQDIIIFDVENFIVDVI